MLDEYVATLKTTPKPRTVIFLVTGTQVLLGYKKTGFGRGNYVGVGGKVEKGETIEAAATREFKEEVCVSLTVPQLKRMAVLKFYFPHITDESWNQEVHAFIVDTWEGQPRETAEIKPVWFDKDSLPLDKMWSDAKYWIPQILTGKKVEGAYLFNQDLIVEEHNEITPL